MAKADARPHRRDVHWAAVLNEALNENGRSLELRESLTKHHWDDDSKKCFGMLTDGRAQVTGIRRRVQDATLYRDFTRVGAAKMPDAKTMVAGV